MGLGSFLKSLVSPTAMAEEMVRLQDAAYREGAEHLSGS